MTAQLPSREMLAQAIERISDAIDDAARLYGENWDSALVGGEPNYHAITSDHTQGIVVKTDDDSLHSSWLCDYLEAVDPASIRLLLARIKELDKAAHEQEPVAYMCDGEDGREYNGHNEFSCGGPGIPLYTHPAPVPAAPDEWRSSLQELVKAMRDYEMDVEEPAPYKHREMMRRAEVLLSEGKS
ncbi:MAG: hypothetical protein KH310_22305 [Enterobacteriaceae bacterium]|nr:hypothetical protein [Enterobacteriaceae bacterium]